MLKSLIVVIALMFTTTAFAQEPCKSTTPWSYSDSDKIALRALMISLAL